MSGRPARGTQRAVHGDRVDTVAPHGALRDHAATLDAAARACDAVARLFETSDPHPEVFRLLADELALLSPDCGHARPANGLAFRMKLLLAAGIVPQLGACATCGEPEHLRGFSAAAGGVVCGSCEASAFPLDEESYRFLVGALGQPLAQAPEPPSARCARPSGRSGRRPSITPMCGSGRCCGARCGTRELGSEERAAPTLTARSLVSGVAGRARCPTSKVRESLPSPGGTFSSVSPRAHPESGPADL